MESPSTNIGTSTTTKKVIASYVVELTESVSGFPLITVTRQEPSEGSCALPVTAMFLGIYETTRTLSSELLSTFERHRQSRC